MSPATFDRKKIVDHLSQRCFGDEGLSAALVCSQKVGKSHLLDLLVEKHAEAQNVFPCRVNLDLVRGGLDDDEQLSDEAFLRFFLDSLRGKIDAWLEEHGEHEAEWSREVEELEEETSSLRQRKRQVLRMRLRELRTLRDVSERLARLLDGEGPLRRPKVLQILNKLARARRRVVLVIDEFNRMLTEPAFSDRLFQFLRGANNDKKIVSVVASTVDLMDDALHRSSSNRERSSYFNHFEHRLVEPFDEEKAKQFLDWLDPEEKLSDEERDYLFEIGGGSPYFLRLAREEFLNAQRPPQERRERYERQLETSCRPGFKTLWERCSEARRSILQQVVTGRLPVETNDFKQLECEGYVVRRDRSPRVFAKLFADFITASKPMGEATDKVKVLFLAADPSDETKLYHHDEVEGIRQAIRRADFRDKLEIESRWSVRPVDLLDSLNEEKPQIVHFSGHGEDEQLLVVGEDGKATPVKLRAITTLFGGARNIRVVVFNSCFSEAQARQVVQHVDCAIGIRGKLSDDAAILFAESFYGAIGYGKSLADAFLDGKTRLMAEDVAEEERFVLLPRPGVDPARVFLIAPKDP